MKFRKQMCFILIIAMLFSMITPISAEDLSGELDKTTLDAAILEAETKAEVDYTAESYAALTSALALSETTQDEVNAKVLAINQAIVELVEASEEPVEADLTAYNAALAAVVEADYTAESWTKYQLVVAANVATAENTQAEVDAATAAITAAQADLVPVEAIGQVRVIVENTTFTDPGAAWLGTLVDTWVSINFDSTMMNAVAEALDTVEATAEGLESNHISFINNLKAFDGGQESGWMSTLNDCFTNIGFGEITVESGVMEPGDEIRIMYTTNGYGEDLGGSWMNNDKTR